MVRSGTRSATFGSLGDFLATWGMTTGRVSLVVLASLLASALILPRWFYALETAGDGVLRYEGAMRAYLATAIALSLCASALFRWGHWTRSEREVWCALGSAFLLLLSIFALDSTWLWEEESWIRYPTAACLLGAGLAGANNARPGRARRGAETLFWLVLTSGFFFLGADELLQIHEGLGDTLEQMALLPSFDEDWITLGYAIVGLVGLVTVWKLVPREVFARRPWLLSGYFTVLVVFTVSQVCDTVDGTVHESLGVLGERLGDRGHQFPDVWYPVYRPRQAMNSIEEILEFAGTVLLLLFTARRARDADLEPVGARSTAAGVGRQLARATFAVGVSFLVILGWPASTSRSPVLVGGLMGESRPGVSRQEFAFGESVDLADGGAFALGGRAGEVELRAVNADEPVRIRLRRMFRDVQGVAADRDGTLLVLTDDDEGQSFVPRIVWAVSR